MTEQEWRLADVTAADVTDMNTSCYGPEVVNLARGYLEMKEDLINRMREIAALRSTGFERMSK